MGLCQAPNNANTHMDVQEMRTFITVKQTYKWKALAIVWSITY